MPVREAVDVLTLGETMLAVRSPGRVQIGGALTASVAGAESNAAIGLARLGHRVRWVGRVGADGPGEVVLRVLRGEGVDVDAVVDPTAPTGALMFEQRLPDATSVTYWRTDSAGSRLTADDVRAALCCGARVLLVSGVTCALGAGPAAAVTAAVDHARANGWLVCLDVNYRSKLWGPAEARAVLAPVAARADLVVGSPDELALVGPAGTPGEHLRDLVQPLLDGGVGEVVAKLGADGATQVDRAGCRHAPARRVPVVDSIGAGDAFTAGYLSALLDGADAEARLRRGTAVAACVVATRGDWEGLPTRGDLDLLERGPGEAVR